MNAKSPAQIKAILGRKSENAAVQKTLSRIYSKFRITGAGPGKLSKLHKIISDRLQAKYGKQKLLIAWAGRDSKYKGEKIIDKIKDILFRNIYPIDTQELQDLRNRFKNFNNDELIT